MYDPRGKNMPHNSGQTRLSGIVYILFLVIFLIISLVVYHFPPYLPVFLIICLSLFLVALLKPDLALVVLILAMLLSPEFYLGGISGRNVTFRFDDALIFVIFFGWIARIAINKEMSLLHPTSLNTPIILYFTVSVLASLMGALEGHVRFQQSVLYLLKYVEYYVLFFMVTNSLRSLKQSKVFVFFLLFTCVVVCIYAWVNVQHLARASAPFEGTEGEPSTLAGYLLFMMSLALGLFLYENRVKWQILFLGVTAFMIPPFLFTLSRGTWIAFFPMSLTLAFMTRRKKGMILLALLSLFLLMPVLFPRAVKDRIAQTFIPEGFNSQQYTVLGKKFTLDESGVRRVESWSYAYNKWVKRPFLGYGVPAGSVIDNSYARVIREVGTIGVCIFIWLMVRIFRAGRKSFNVTKGNNFAQGLSLGFLAGFVGLLFHSFSSETFILIRIMEPFWFVAAMVIALPDLVDKESQLESIKEGVT